MIIKALQSVDGEFIPLNNIESINSGTKFMEEADLVIDKLKADKHIRITTFSGHRYICSMLQIIEILNEEYPNALDLPKSVDECYGYLVYPSWEKLWRDKKSL